MVEYSVKDVLKLLLKRFYVWLICGAALSLAAMPLVQQYYNTAKTHYENAMNYDLLLEAARAAQESAKASLAVEIPDSVVNMSSVQSVYTVAFPSSPAEDDALHIDAVSSLLHILSQDYFLVSVFNALPDEVRVVSYSAFAEAVRADYLPGLNQLEISFSGLFSTTAQEAAGAYRAALTALANDRFRGLLTLSFVADQTNPAPLASLSSDDFIEAAQIAADKLAFNQMILKEPSLNSNRLRVMVSAGILGVLVGCLLVLVFDYMRLPKRIAKEKLRAEQS